MIDANKVLATMCKSNQDAVNANDATVYRNLFAVDAIRNPPGSDPERGRDEISTSEQEGYDISS